jgi:hypothetical protein
VIDDVVPVGDEVADQVLAEIEAGVVGGDVDAHDEQSIYSSGSGGRLRIGSAPPDVLLDRFGQSGREDRTAGAAALDLEETVVRCHGDDAVP